MSIKSLRRRLDEIRQDFAPFDRHAEAERSKAFWLQAKIDLANQFLEMGAIDAKEAERMIDEEKRRPLSDFFHTGKFVWTDEQEAIFQQISDIDYSITYK